MRPIISVIGKAPHKLAKIMVKPLIRELGNHQWYSRKEYLRDDVSAEKRGHVRKKIIKI